MNVTITKNPDGVSYMTKDGHGELFSGPVDDAVQSFGDNTVVIVDDPHVFAEPGDLVVEFSWVDYLDTTNREEPSAGVRHTVQRKVPGRFDAGPYVVEVAEKKSKK